MGLQPKIEKKSEFTLKQCNRCHQSFGAEGFCRTKSIIFSDGFLPICNDCIDIYIQGEQNKDHDSGNWRRVDKMCQLTDVPFIPAKWEVIYQMNHINAFARYSALFQEKEYQGIGWDDYFEHYKELKERGALEKELPELSEEKLRQQKERWGANYDEQALNYLDKLYNGLMTTQNVNGTLQIDQALKICKMSYEIDCRIRQGEDFDKALGAYDKLVKIAEFTPKNVKNINDFETSGEMIKWLQKRGWKNKYYDGVDRDIVDQTIKNIQSFNQRLYTNQSGIGDDITHRIQMLKSVGRLSQESQGYFLDDSNYDLDNYENDGYNELLKEQEFDPVGGR